MRPVELYFAYDREVQLGFSDVVDVLDPGFMAAEVVGRQTDNLDVSLSEVCSTTRDFA